MSIVSEAGRESVNNDKVVKIKIASSDLLTSSRRVERKLHLTDFGCHFAAFACEHISKNSSSDIDIA